MLQQLDAVRERLAGEVGGRARHLDERELERQAGIAALAHVVDGHGQQVAEPQHDTFAELVRLGAQPLPRLLGHRQRVGHLAHVLDEEQVPQVLEEVGDEAAEILPLLGELLDERERAGGVAVDDEVADPEERLLLDGSEQLEDRLDAHLPLGRRGELVERRDGVAERAARAAGDQCERLVGRLDPLAVGDAAQQSDELGQARAREDEGLAARAHRVEHLVQVGGAEDEDEVRRRLLDQLQQRVEGGRGELVRLVEDVDLVAALGRLEDHALADLADVVDPALRGRVHLDHVERAAVRDRLACVTGLVGGRGRPLRAVERLREDAREARLAGAARAGEEVGLAHLVVLDRVPQRADDRLLPDHLVEVLRAVFPVERGHERRLHCRCPRDCDRSEPRQIREEAALRIARRSPGFGRAKSCDFARVERPASGRGHRPPSRQWRRGTAVSSAPGRIAQRESARFTRGRSLVRSQVRPLNLAVAHTHLSIGPEDRRCLRTGV